MRRADRLFRIVQILRRRRLTTAAHLAERLEVSERTIYRDIADLGRSGVPVRGEAGVGYCLDRGFDLPPLMFDLEEIQALVLGVRMVQSWGDEGLRGAATQALEKIEAVLPSSRQSTLQNTALYALSFSNDKKSRSRLRKIRLALDGRQKIEVHYSDQKSQNSRRVLYPLGLYFWGRTWTLGAWCELRKDFRSFRVDRIESMTTLSEQFPQGSPYTVDDYVKAMTADHEEK